MPGKKISSLNSNLDLLLRESVSKVTHTVLMLWLAPELEGGGTSVCRPLYCSYAVACCDCLLSGASEHFSSWTIENGYL